MVTEESDDASMEKVMIWSEYEAYVLQVKQIGVSACGATAVINVLVCYICMPLVLLEEHLHRVDTNVNTDYFSLLSFHKIINM